MACKLHPREGVTRNGTCLKCRQEELKMLEEAKVWDRRPQASTAFETRWGHEVPASPDRRNGFELKRVKG